MKQAYNNDINANNLMELLSAQKILEDKTRINIYMPKIIVRLIDYLAKDMSRGDLVSRLIVQEIKRSRKLPYGMFAGTEISEKEIDKITSGLDRTVNELT